MTFIKNTWLSGQNFQASDENAIASAVDTFILNPTAVKTSAYSAAPMDFVPVDATSGPVTITLANAPGDENRVAVQKVDTSANAVTVACAGADVFIKTGGPTTAVLSNQGDGIVAQYSATPKVWYQVEVHERTPSGGWLETDLTSALKSKIDSALQPPTGAADITTAATVVMGETNTYNTSSGGAAFAPALPALSGLTAGQYAVVAKSGADTSASLVTITCAGADVFDDGSTTLALRVTGEKRTLQVVSIGGTKKWQSVAGINPVTAMDRRYGMGDVFNWKASNTRHLQRSMAKVVAGVGMSHHLVIGDSETSSYVGNGSPVGTVGTLPGTLAGQNYNAVWPHLLRNIMSAKGVQLGGTGWVFTADSEFNSDPRWTTTGTWSSSSAGFLDTTNNGATLTFTSDVIGTTVALAYLQQGSFSVAIDGGTATPITTSGGATALGVHTFTGLANTTHTVTITNTSTTQFFPIAINVYGSAGVQVTNSAIIGATAGAWATAGYANRPWMLNALGSLSALSPDVIHVVLGVNDMDGSVAVSTIVASLTTIRGQWPNADCVLYGQYQMDTTQVGNAGWPAYIQALYQLAVTLDCPLIDLYQRSGGSVAAAANGLMGDPVHPNAIAHADIAQLVSNLILKGL